MTHVPSVVVDAYKSHAELLLTDGIERTGDRLAPLDTPGTEGTLKSTKTTVGYRLTTIEILDIMITGEHAVFLPHDTCHEVAVVIGISHSLLINNALRRG